MKAMHWVGIGCGGCAIVVLSITLLLVGGVLFVRNQAKQAEEYHRKVESLKKTYPYQIPADHAIQPERFDTFLHARETLFDGSQPLLNPVIEIAAMPKDETLSYPVFLKGLAQFLLKTSTLSESQWQVLHEAGMSPKEYEYLTNAMGYEILAWQTGEKTGTRNELARDYFAPLERFENRIRHFEETHSGTNIDHTPFHYSEYVKNLKRAGYINETNSDIILAHQTTIWDNTATVFLDAWIVGF
ncbi:hypothetical protein GF373_10990 [bacterium]|nr:hypothetical protein [bacterium]